MDTATLLLPARSRFGGQRLSDPTARRLGQADRQQLDDDPLARVFDVLPRGWPVAAVTRQRDAGDAAHSAWLRADPAYVRPDINGARLLAFGPALGLDERDSAALLPALRPVFGDAGFTLDAPSPSRWYLRLPLGARLPAFAPPEAALGADLLEHLPGIEGDPSPEARRWRALLNEAQVVLHNHPHNAWRGEAGLAPINSLWFWGAGVLPDHVRSSCTHVRTNDSLLAALAHAAGVRGDMPGEGDVLVDYRALATFDDAFLGWIASAVAGQLPRLVLDFADGARWEIRRAQRWRFWRRPAQHLPA